MEKLFDILLRFWEPIKNFGPKLPTLIVGVLVGIILIKLISEALSRTLKLARMPKALSGIITSLIIIVAWVLLFSELARELGLSSVALTVSGSLVVLGLALANGATSLTSDIISGVFVAKDQDFEVGYKVKIGDIEGVVVDIDIRKVRILDDEKTLHIIPNASLDKSGWSVIEREQKDEKIKKVIISFKNKKKG